MMPRSRALLLVGPTAVGKSDLAVRVAEAVGGEIVSLDSRQMVRGLDRGTAKPTPAQRARVPHHLVDVVPPDAAPTLAEVVDWIHAAVDGILARGRRPVLVGGTGQYVRAIREGWQVPAVPPDPALRARLAAVAEAQGPAALHELLADVDPASAAAIDARNVRRVIRAMEIHAFLGRPASAARGRAGSRYELLTVGLDRPRPSLYARVDERIDAMLAQGLEDEVRALVTEGYGWHLPALSSLGYGEWRDYLAGQIGRDEVVRRIRHNTRRLVRNQATWFRADDVTIRWFDLSRPGSPESVVSLVRDWFEGEKGGDP
jgi:tRNA dimethylallyltransferase